MENQGLSARAGLLKPSPTLGITARANAMRAAGGDVISLAAGEPDFRTPEAIGDAAIQAIKDGFTRYTPSAGTPELRKTIAATIEREKGVVASPDQVIVSCGAKQSLYNTMMMLLNEGDEVIVFAPYWMTYIDQIELAGGKPVVISTRAEDEFVPSNEAIRAAITPRTKMIVVNSPSNPTGAVYPRETMAFIGEVVEEHQVWLVSDEIYEKLVYDGASTSALSLSKEVQSRTILINGCSKTYAMTGWRIGFAFAPLPIAKAMSNFQDQVTSNPNSIAQKGAVAAFGLPNGAVEAMRQEFENRRNQISSLLLAIPKVRLAPPKGAFYVFPDVSPYLNGGSDMQLAEGLLEQAGVATIPGSVFGGPGHLRLSYAASQRDIEEGVSRIAKYLGALG